MPSTCHLWSKALLRRLIKATAQCIFLLAVTSWLSCAHGMTDREIHALRRETEHLFYHGFDNYMLHAFPEDELKPLSCEALTRDAVNPGHIELNDPLGNYSLTLIDSLSTLAVLASSSTPLASGNKALKTFQDSIIALVDLYGDGTKGPGGQGKRGRGFDVDSKVQVFETVIRGVGGLLSAHLFAVGELPITGYNPQKIQFKSPNGTLQIRWSRQFTYNGQLLRLAHDLGRRLLPAFTTSTGIPYPRVNLRHGVPFYKSSPLNSIGDEICQGSDFGQCHGPPQVDKEITETCSAGAGSLTLEFTVLSRLTGDLRFEQLAKRAFWSIWERRSNIGLVGSGIDAESGLWTSPYTGIGAGIDSFFEYAMKTYVLLSGSEVPDVDATRGLPTFDYSAPLKIEQHTAESFLEVWRAAHASLKRHLYRGDMYIHPHYIQADLYTGASRAFWIDSLSAFFPGLLTMTGDLDEAIKIHLLFTALWTRYSALPERWSSATGNIESGLGWWGGRPEFIESTYHLYRATNDPWYLHVGEMALRDIKRRCWTKCGWSGIQDVRSGERSDRMESFFLGETAKYLHLLFDTNHPLNKLDAPFVFTTEGHPLIIPKSARQRNPGLHNTYQRSDASNTQATCPKFPESIPFSVSQTAARTDLFHAANLARLQYMPTPESLGSPLIEYSSDHPSISPSDIQSPSNYTYFPWTLPLELIPHNGTCSKLTPRPTFDITFPALPNSVLTPGMLQRVGNGILIGGMAGLRLGMIQDVHIPNDESRRTDLYRVQAINSMPLGKDEKLFLSKDVLASVVNALDPNFTRVRDLTMLDIVVDARRPSENPVASRAASSPEANESSGSNNSPLRGIPIAKVDQYSDAGSQVKLAFGNLMQHVSSMLLDQSSTVAPQYLREYVPAITPTGAGVAPLPDVQEALSPDPSGASQGSLLWDTIFITGQNCDKVLAPNVPREHQIIVIKRGGCSFNQKIQNIPSFAPSKTSLQLVIVVSFEDDHGWLIRPLLESPQFTSSGLPRHNPIPMIMVGGGETVYDILHRAVAVGIKRRYSVQAQGVPISNLIII